jgi:hypothetical protein
MYRIGTDDEVNAQVEALPDELLPYYAQLLDLLELAPWHSEPYSNAKPDGVMRKMMFGPPGRMAEAIFLVLERDRRVEIVRVVWIH